MAIDSSKGKKNLVKIGVEAQCLTKTLRGVGYYTLTLLEALKNEQLLCYRSNAILPSPFSEIPFHPFSKKIPFPFSNSLAALFRFRCFDNREILHFPEPKILYGEKPSVPFVITIHDVMPLLFPHFFPKKSRLMMRYFLPRFLKEATAIVAVSHQTKSDLLKFFNLPEEKIHVIPCTLLPKKRIPSSKKDPFLFYIGSFEPRKNLSGLIQAFSLLKKKGFPHKLVLAGKEEKGQRIPYDLIEKLDLKKEILCKGYLSETEKENLFQKAQALIWPSFYEGFGIPLLEAMASGTPIITSDVPPIRETVQDAALLANPYDPRDIGEKMITLVSSEERTNKLIQKGLERAADFSLDLFREKILTLYRSIYEKI